MKKSLLITAISLIVVGAILFTVALTMLDFNLSTVEYETNTYVIGDTFDKISVDVKTAQIAFAQSDDESCKIVCQETEKVKHSAVVRDGTLVIGTTDSREWYDYIGIFSGHMKLTIYLPQNEYTSLRIDTDTGDVEIPKGFCFESVTVDGDTADIACYASVSERIEISTDTGEIRLSDAQCKAVAVESDTGDITFTNILAETLWAETNTGDVEFQNSDADSICVETDTGDVTGTLRSGKIFACETDTGDVDVPESTSGGECRISTDTGDITLRIH